MASACVLTIGLIIFIHEYKSYIYDLLKGASKDI